ncbi:hypothetical protein [Palaeococcus sp. (in: euryarchaeotes)]|uniref:hypothetical protein n=1 Tax=Palaeococcus sp. (in: euryarchaeotes) TaxID=2820298 RepID=UPI0025F041E8|nr:hypothetical protein [Palaeococcus sp. (in: euryarchaeotes)]
MTMRWKLLGVLLLSLLVLSSFSLVSANKTQDPWEEWAKEHTLRVLVVEELTYKNGELVKQVEYTGNELNAKFGVRKLSRIEKTKVDRKTLEKLYPLKAQALIAGKVIRKVYYKTTVITTSDDPFPWWEYYPYLPRWTWKVWYDEFSIPHYEKADPVNLVWEGGTKSEVKIVLDNAGWYDWAVASDQHIYDPPQYGGGGWEEGDDMATRWLGLQGRYHIRLWVIYNGKIIGSAHHDTSAPHEVDTFEGGEDEVASYYGSPWFVNEDWIYLDNKISGKNDGYATVIWK